MSTNSTAAATVVQISSPAHYNVPLKDTTSTLNKSYNSNCSTAVCRICHEGMLLIDNLLKIKKNSVFAFMYMYVQNQRQMLVSLSLFFFSNKTYTIWSSGLQLLLSQGWIHPIRPHQLTQYLPHYLTSFTVQIRQCNLTCISPTPFQGHKRLLQVIVVYNR